MFQLIYVLFFSIFPSSTVLNQQEETLNKVGRKQFSKQQKKSIENASITWNQLTAVLFC